jgi:hypothetical protein
MNSFLSNDSLPLKNGGTNMWRLAQNARIPTLGDYETRKGFDFHSDAAGETADASQTSTTGAADQAVSNTVRIAKKVVFSTTGRCTRLDVNLKNSASATGTVMVELWSDSGGAPSEMLARSSVAASDIDTSYAYEIARVAEAPSVTATTYWCVAYVQTTGTGSYYISSTTNASTGLTSTDSGTTWSAASVDFNVKAYLSTTGGTLGLHRAYKSDGTSKTLFAHGTTLRSVSDATGALTSIKTGLDASATKYRFTGVNDTVYYVNGYDGLRKWNFTTESQVSTTDYTLICEHKGMLFLVTADDPNKLVFSNFADYETFTSTDFIYVPSPKTGDPITALVSLNGYLLIFTRYKKYILTGSDNATYTLEEAPDKKGTYTQETVTHDKNFVYYLSDDGVYRSNGSEAQLMSEGAYQEIIDISSKEDACLAVNKGRLYMWYKSPSSSANDVCRVWNLNFGQGSTDCLESYDTDAYVARAVTAFNDDDDFIVASSLVGQAFYQEQSSNDNTNLGGDIDFLLQTHYMTFDNPGSLKEIRYWNPRFDSQSGNYTVDCQYAYDLRDNWTTQSSPNLQGSGSTWGGGETWGGDATWGTTAETQSQLYVPGEYRRIALRYKHYATRQPVGFLGHTLKIQVRRMR